MPAAPVSSGGVAVLVFMITKLVLFVSLRERSSECRAATSRARFDQRSSAGDTCRDNADACLSSERRSPTRAASSPASTWPQLARCCGFSSPRYVRPWPGLRRLHNTWIRSSDPIRPTVSRPPFVSAISVQQERTRPFDQLESRTWRGGHDLTFDGERAASKMQCTHLRTLYGDSPTTRRWASIIRAEVIAQPVYHNPHGISRETSGALSKPIWPIRLWRSRSTTVSAVPIQPPEGTCPRVPQRAQHGGVGPT